MARAEPAGPRWPDVAAGRAHYESYYLRAVDPTGRRGVWIRCTVSLRPGGPPDGQLWFTFCDRSAGPPRTLRVDAGTPTDRDTWIRLGNSRFGPSPAPTGRPVLRAPGLLVAALPGR